MFSLRRYGATNKRNLSASVEASDVTESVIDLVLIIVLRSSFPTRANTGLYSIIRLFWSFVKYNLHNFNEVIDNQAVLSLGKREAWGFRVVTKENLPLISRIFTNFPLIRVN